MDKIRNEDVQQVGVEAIDNKLRKRQNMWLNMSRLDLKRWACSQEWCISVEWVRRGKRRLKETCIIVVSFDILAVVAINQKDGEKGLM